MLSYSSRFPDLLGGGLRYACGEREAHSAAPREHWPRPPDLPELQRAHLPHTKGRAGREAPHIR